MAQARYLIDASPTFSLPLAINHKTRRVYTIGETGWVILETQEDIYRSIYQYELLDSYGEIMATCDNHELPAIINLVTVLYRVGPEIPAPVADEIKRLFDAQMATIFKGFGAAQKD